MSLKGTLQLINITCQHILSYHLQTANNKLLQVFYLIINKDKK